MAGIGSSLGGPGGDMVRQLFLWQVIGQVVSVLASPAFQALQRAVDSQTQTEPLTAAQLADMVVRDIVDHATATSYAAETGFSAQDFQRMVQSAGDAPSPTELVMALRRGLIPRDGTGPDAVSFQQGIAEGRTFNKYTQMLEQLGDVPLSPAECVDAVVENQISYDQGQAIAFLSGMSADSFRIAVNTRGNPPSPMELVTLYKRGLIPLDGTGPDALSVHQGIAEGATKDKWWHLLAALAEYVPPPRTVVAMVREGSLTDAQALDIFHQAGLTPELSKAYLESAHHQKLAATRELAESQVEKLYEDQVITRAEAAEFLGALGWNAQEQEFKLELVDLKRVVKAREQVLTRLHNLYVNHKTTKQVVSSALDATHVPPSQRDQLLQTWDLERGANVRVLTPAEITSAYKDGLIDQGTATLELTNQGFTPIDAWILLSLKMGAAQPDQPGGAP